MCFNFHRGASFERLRDRIAPKNDQEGTGIGLYVYYYSMFGSYGVEHQSRIAFGHKVLCLNVDLGGL